MMLTAQQMQSLPDFFLDIPDPRRPQGRRHSLLPCWPSLVLRSCVACVATKRSPTGRKVSAQGQREIPLPSGQRAIRGAERIDHSRCHDSCRSIDLERSVQRWNQAYGQQDSTLAIDGKTMCNALDKNGHQTHVMSVVGHHTKSCYTQKKSAACPPRGDSEELKQTNEIGMAIPLLDSVDLKDKDITADALLTQRKLAEYLVLKRQAHYHFTVKGNQATLLEDLALIFNDRKQPNFVMHDPPDHGRIETRKSGPPLHSTVISTSPMSAKPSPSNGSPSTKKPANPPTKSPTASPAVLPNKPRPPFARNQPWPLDHRKQLPLHSGLELR